MGSTPKRTMAAAATGLLLTGAGWAGLALAQDHGADWLRKPSMQQLQEVMPAGAMRAGVNGSATIGCTVTTVGTLRDCKVEAEDPPGMGFGDAALLLAPRFLMGPAVKNGQAVEGHVRIPINWKGMYRVAPPER